MVAGSGVDRVDRARDTRYVCRHLIEQPIDDVWDNAITETLRQKLVTYDLHRQMEGAVKLKTS